MMRKPVYRILVVALSLVIFVSVAYAATTHRLLASNYVNIRGIAALEIVNFSIPGIRVGETVGYAPGHGTTRDVIQVSWYVANPSDTRSVELYLRNVGSANVVLGAWETTLPNTAHSGLIFSFPNLEGIVIPPGSTFGPYTLSTYWDPAYAYVPGGTNEFQAWINYHK